VTDPKAFTKPVTINFVEDPLPTPIPPSTSAAKTRRIRHTCAQR
jgi:hypothetical protein